MAMTPKEFSELRYGFLTHYGLFSLLERGEWALNREALTTEEIWMLHGKFKAENFNAAGLCASIRRAGMRYVIIPTMHADGFRLFPTQYSHFNSNETPARRDLVEEFVKAARQEGLKIGLYHSLNNLADKPDGADALEDPGHLETFRKATYRRLVELVKTYAPVDILWYDIPWPLSADDWQAEEMNRTLREVQPDLLFNGLNGASGDYDVFKVDFPQKPYQAKPWELVMPASENWGYHIGDENYKSPETILRVLTRCAQYQGNCLLNFGLKPDGSLPNPALKLMERVGDWLQKYGEAVYTTERFFARPGAEGQADRGDTCHHGYFTAQGNNLYLTAPAWPGSSLIIGGMETKVKSIRLLGKSGNLNFRAENGRIILHGLPDQPIDDLASVFVFECDSPPRLGLCEGSRRPQSPHPRYL